MTRQDPRDNKGNDAQTRAPSFVSTAPHEFGAHLIFTDDDLAPYWAARSRIRDVDGGKDDMGTFAHNARTYRVSIGYQKSGLAPRPQDQIEEVHEYRLHIEDVDGPERTADFLIQPRWQDMKTTEGKSVSTPDLLGVNVKTQGSNIEFSEYPRLLQKAASVAGIRGTYFSEDKIHPFSSIYDAARYVRVRRDKSKPIYGANGILRQIAELTRDEGYAKIVWDDEEINGYYHTATFSSSGAAELLEHRYAKEVKHYHPEHVRHDADDPLYHPKLEAAYQNSKDEHTVKWDDLDALSRELDETVLNVLEWADLPTTHDGYHYIDRDEYHDHGDEKRRRQIIEDPTPKLRDEQNAVVVQKLREMNESDISVLQELIGDGGKTADELEDETEYHLSTVYRALNRMDELVTHEKGEIQVASEYMARRLNDAVEDAQERVRDALSLSAEVVEKSADELERRGGALRDWMATYGVELEDEPDDIPEFEVNRENGRDIKKILREGLSAWKRAGRDEWRFLSAEVRYFNREVGAPQYRRVRAALGKSQTLRNRR